MESSFKPRNSVNLTSSISSDIQRPPIYNAEDYANYLRKYCTITELQLYLNTGTDIQNKSVKTKMINKGVVKNDSFRGNDKHQNEMGLRQFTSVSELLRKLNKDLHLSYRSFLKEFVSEPNNGVSLLLDLLKVIQLSQTNIAGVNCTIDSKVHQTVLKKALADEHEVLLCLNHCTETEDGGI